MKINTPLEQFKITPILRIYNNWLDLTITNSTIFLLLSTILVISLISGS